MKIDLERKALLEEELARILEKLKHEYDPEKIFLFGSLVSGQTSRWSDIDLVVIKETKKRFPQRLREVALLTRPRVGVDFLVYTPKEFKKMTQEPSSFQSIEILRNGKVLYDRS